jgi:hypothetical protein
MTPARHGAAPFRFISFWFNRIPLTIRLPYFCNTAQCFLEKQNVCGVWCEAKE